MLEVMRIRTSGSITRKDRAVEHGTVTMMSAPHDKLTFETAAAQACTQVPVVAPMTRAVEIRQGLVGQRYESATHIVVCEGGIFRGILPIEDLLVASEEARAQDLMDPEPPYVAPGVDQEVAAWHAVHHAESALAVVALPFLIWRWGESALALGVALSLCAACSTATIAARTLPGVLDRLNLDPAFGSGPLATVMQDVLSIIIYFAVVTAIVS